MKTYGERRYRSTFVSFDIRWKWVLSFSIRSLYPSEEALWYPLDRRFGGPRNRFVQNGETKNLLSLPGVVCYCRKTLASSSLRLYTGCTTNSGCSVAGMPILVSVRCQICMRVSYQLGEIFTNSSLLHLYSLVCVWLWQLLPKTLHTCALYWPIIVISGADTLLTSVINKR
jgi:hypothetical protein